MYIRDAWYVAAWSHEVDPSSLAPIQVFDERIVIWRNDGSQLAAFEDRCVHRFAPLSLGRCEGRHLRCMYHGFAYDIAGRVVEIPGQSAIPDSAKLHVYPTAERHGWIWIWMGPSEKADENLIPDVTGIDEPGFVTGYGQLDYKADANLLIENLLDLSHLSFLHAKSAGVSGIWAQEPPRVSRHSRSVRCERWIEGEGPSGTLWADEQVDTYHCLDFYIPGALTMSARIFPVGTAAAYDRHPPASNVPLQGFSTQAITPMTNRTSRYFYIMGSQATSDQSSYDMTAALEAFAEDKVMIEAQQAVIDSRSPERYLMTRNDRGILEYNKLVSQILRDAR